MVKKIKLEEYILFLKFMNSINHHIFLWWNEVNTISVEQLGEINGSFPCILKIRFRQVNTLGLKFFFEESVDNYF